MGMEHQWWCGGKAPCACTDGWKKEQEEKATWATHMAVLSRWAYCPACVKRLGIPDGWDEHDKRDMLRKLRAYGMTYAEWILDPKMMRGSGMEKVEAYECLMLMVPWGVARKLEALAEVEGVTPKVMAARLIAEAGEDYYGKALEGDD